VTIHNVKSSPNVQLDNRLLITRDVTGKYEGGGGSSLGWGVPGGGVSAPARPPVSMPQILPAYRSPVSVPRSVNAPLNNVQIRQSSGVNVGGGMQIAKPIKPQSKKPVYGPPLPTKAQLQVLKSKTRQKTRAGSLPSESNHRMKTIVFDKDALKNGANNSLSFQKKDKHDPTKPPFCTLTINRVHNVIRREGQFDSDGRAKIEPLAENDLTLTGTLKTTYPNAKLSLQMSISKTDVGMVTSPTKISKVRHYPRYTYVRVKMNGFKSVIPEFLTPGELERNGTTFKGRTEKIISMPDFHYATCIIDNKEASIIEFYNKSVIQNGVLVRK
jgi:hypothetical protein